MVSRSRMRMWGGENVLLDGKRQRAAMADRLLKEGMGPYAEEVLSKMVATHNLVALPVAEHVRGMMQAAHPIGALAQRASR